MDVLNLILFGKKFGICAFCGRKTKLSNSVFRSKNMCVCHKCNSLIKLAPFNFLHKGTEYVSFIVSPLYYTPLVRYAIHNLKFSSIPENAKILGYYINSYISVLETDESLLSDFDFLVPVPLSSTRQNMRGYNQAELVALEIGKHFNIEVRNDILRKVKDSPPQSTLSPQERFNNLSDAYECIEDVKDKRILLIDDVFTTGSTLDACAKALIDSGALKVGAITASCSSFKEHSENYNELFS